MIRSGGPSGEACPVCPYRGLSETETACPSCGTDLSPLRALQALPASILDQGVGLAARGDIEGSVPLLQAAALFPGTREPAVALLLRIVDRCLNPECPAFGRRGNGRMALAGSYGDPATPMWRCSTCHHSFSGARNSVLFRSRLPRAEAYGVLVELLKGSTIGEVTGRGSRSAAAVGRLALRAAELGPRVIDEIAAATGRPARELRAGWRRFARAVRSAGSGPG